jgi:hypothetical protein
LVGTFTANYDFHRFPFDVQALSIGFQNTRVQGEQIVYVIDTRGLPASGSASAMQAVSDLDSWQYRSTEYVSDSFVSRSTRGDPRLFGTNVRSEYSGMQTIVSVSRRAETFVFKQLLPLALLILIVYASLFFPISLLDVRLTIPVTALLAGIVLLSSINSSLPDIGYTTDLEYFFYIFFALCFVCILVAALVEWLHNDHHEKYARRVDNITRVVYVLVITAMLLIGVLLSTTPS